MRWLTFTGLAVVGGCSTSGSDSGRHGNAAGTGALAAGAAGRSPGAGGTAGTAGNQSRAGADTGTGGAGGSNGNTTAGQAGEGDAPGAAGETDGTPEGGAAGQSDGGGAGGVAGSALAGTGNAGMSGGRTGGTGGRPPKCTAEEHLCGDVCVTNDAVAHCGESCTPCETPVNGTVSCDSSACVFDCDDGYVPCGQPCQPESILGCGPSCAQCLYPPPNGTPICLDGGCDFTCFNGYHRCGDECAANDSPAACGASCTVCPAPPENASATCVAEACGFECLRGYALVNGACVYSPIGCLVASTGGKYFAMCGLQRNWADAKAFCEAAPNWHLASITSAEQDAFVLELIGSDAWIGLNDLATEGVLRWDAGEAVSYQNWCDGEPNDQFGNEDCVVAARDAPYCGACMCWNDGACTSLHAFVCEYVEP